MCKPHPTILSALTLVLLLLFTACGQQSDIPHPVIANPADAAAAVTDFAPEEPHRSPAGRAVLLVLLILLALVLVWGAVGAAMSAQLLPEFDLGYGWFNETIYPVFSAFPMQ